MNNLKRVFSLVLALVMVVGLVMVGASAASADFDDSDEITKTEAVNTLVALGVIKGKDDGSFHPTDDVTRGEMAKMIYVVMNNGKDNPNLTTKATPSFTDIKGHWAEGYIEYCYSTGIISGRGDGTFDPNANVTAQEAAKMVLIALGYSEKEEELTGKDWALHTNILALQNDLYDNVDPLPSADANRDNAAQIIYNAGNSYVITKYENTLTTDANGNLKTVGTAVQSTVQTLFAKKFGLDYATSYVTKVTLKDGTYTYTLADTDAFGVDKIGSKAYENSYKTTDDYTNLFGQKVQVIYKPVAGGDDTIYGLKGLGTVVAEGAYSAIENDDDYKDVPVVAFNSTEKYEDAKDIDAYVAIDNDKDDEADVVVVTPVVAAKVTAKSATAISVPGVEKTGAQLELKKVTGADALAKGDYVLGTPAAYTVDGKTALTKAETVTGTVAATRGEKNDEIRIGSTWYKPASTLLSGSAETISRNDEITLVVTNGLYVFADQAEATSVSKDLVLITKIGETDKLEGTTAARAVFTGTTSVTTIRFSNDKGAVEAGKLYTYELKDGVYTLTAATTKNTGYDSEVTGVAYSKEAGALADDSNTVIRIADDAEVFVLYGKKDGEDTDKVDNIENLLSVKVLTGKAVKDWDADFGDTDITTGFTGKTNGIEYAKVVVLAADAEKLPGDKTEESDTQYGYIVSDASVETENKVNYVVFDIWNGTENVTVKAKGDDATAPEFKKGTLIAYTESNGVITIDKKAEFVPIAITGYSASDLIIAGLDRDGEAVDFDITSKAVYLYIDSKAVAGAAEQDIAFASVDDTSGDSVYTLNAALHLNDKGAVDVIFVEVNNALVDEDGEAVTVTVKGEGDDEGEEEEEKAVTSFTLSGTTVTLKDGAEATGNVITVTFNPTDAKGTIKATVPDASKEVLKADVDQTAKTVTITIIENATVSAGEVKVSIAVDSLDGQDVTVTLQAKD